MSLFVALFLLSTPGAETADECGLDPKIPEAVMDAVEATLDPRRASQAKKALNRAILKAPSSALEEVLGWSMLVLGERGTAKRVLGRIPSGAVGAARAELGQPGGQARARTRLVESVSSADAPTGAVFLAALAFSEAGQHDRAHELLEKAIARAPSALDETFAPDAVTQLARATLRFAAKCQVTDAAPRVAGWLLDAGRVSEAQRLAKELLSQRELSPELRPALLRILINTVNATDARKALEQVEKVLTLEPDAKDALAARIVLLLRAGRNDEAKKALAALPPIQDSTFAASIALARAQLALREKSGFEDALASVQAAIREDPKNDEAVALYARLLLASDKVERATEFAVLLLGRKPRDVDPFSLLAEVHEAKHQPDQTRDNRLRSAGFAAEKKKLERVVMDRESIFRAVRDAESGVGVAGLTALGAEFPSLSLPVDLALAKMASPGARRVARERILSACGPRWTDLLSRKGSFDVVKIDLSLYGKVESNEAPLTAADPGRCSDTRRLRK